MAFQVPDDIARFILTSVPSVPFLEALLLTRNEQNVPWDSSRLALRLYLSERAATTLLHQLQAAGMLKQLSPDPATYVYQPSTTELKEILDRLADCYSRHLVEVSNLIHSKSARNAQQFADAFKWRKEV